MRDMDADVICQPFLSEERPGMQQTSHLLGPHVICGTHFPEVAKIFPVKRSSFSKTSLIKFWPFTRINPGVQSLVTFDRHGRRSNSLNYHYRNRTVRQKLDKITTI